MTYTFTKSEKMILQSITKGNLNLVLTKNTYKHENNLRFHLKIDGRFYEYPTCTINKGTLNLQCVVHIGLRILQSYRYRLYGSSLYSLPIWPII